MLDELILQNIKTTLEKTPGFSSSTIRRFAQVGLSYDVMPCIDVCFGGSILKGVLNAALEYEMSVYIDIYDRDDSTATDTVLDVLVTNCITELIKDPSRGGFALKTHIDEIIPMPSIIGQPECGRTIKLLITYRCKTKNPAQAG